VEERGRFSNPGTSLIGESHLLGDKESQGRHLGVCGIKLCVWKKKKNHKRTSEKSLATHSRISKRMVSSCYPPEKHPKVEGKEKRKRQTKGVLKFSCSSGGKKGSPKGGATKSMATRNDAIKGDPYIFIGKREDTPVNFSQKKSTNNNLTKKKWR